MTITGRFDRHAQAVRRVAALTAEIKAIQADPDFVADQEAVLSWFRRHVPEGVRDWRHLGLIYHFRPGRRVMDQAAVKEALGADTPYKRSEPSEQLEPDIQSKRLGDVAASASA